MEQTRVQPGRRIPARMWMAAIAVLGMVAGFAWFVRGRDYFYLPSAAEQSAAGSQSMAGLPFETGTPDTTAAGEAASGTLSAVVADPAIHLGQTVSGSATVAELVSDRSFWIEDDGKRLLVITDGPMPETPGITTGKRVQLSGTMHDATQM